MLNQQSFQSIGQSEKYKIQNFQNALILTGDMCNYEIGIDLRTTVKWIVQDGEIFEMKVQNLSIDCYKEQLKDIKENLDLRVLYEGIVTLYTLEQQLTNKTQSKICVLKSKLNDKLYGCKSLKKCFYEREHIEQLVLNLKRIQHLDKVIECYEVFNSKKHYYITFELLNSLENRKLGHEQIQELMFQLFQVLNQLVGINLVPVNLSLKKIMLGKNNQIKLSGIEYERYHSQIFLKEVGVIMDQLYNYHYIGELIDDIPNEGKDLINRLLNYRTYNYTLQQAMEHQYFEFGGEDKQINYPSLVFQPKFKQDLLKMEQYQGELRIMTN